LKLNERDTDADSRTTTFRTGRSVAAMLLFFPGVLAVMFGLIALMTLRSGNLDVDDVVLFGAIIATSLWAMTQGRSWVKGRLELGPEGIATQGRFRRNELRWDAVSWVWIGIASKRMPKRAPGIPRPSPKAVAGGASPLVSLASDRWVVLLENLEGQRVVVAASNLYDHQRAAPVLGRYLQQHVDEGVIEDRIGFLS